MKTLYISDLDGTLLMKNERISDFSLQTINSLIGSGMLFTFATARSIHSASPVTKGLELQIPAIVHNGVFIINVTTGEKLMQNFFTRNEVETVSAFLNEQGIYPLVYSIMDGRERVSWLSGTENSGIKNYLSYRKGDIRFREAQNTGDLYQGEVFTFTCIGGQGDLDPVYDYFSKIPSFYAVIQLDIYYPEYWCEINPQNATKANAALQLKKILECDRIISFGDGMNDIPLFEVSDECYAVANAKPELKEKATGIIDTNENDGVAKWLLEKFK